MEMSQRFHLDHLNAVLETAMKGCKDIYEIFDTVVREHLAETGSASTWGIKYSSTERTVQTAEPMTLS